MIKKVIQFISIHPQSTLALGFYHLLTIIVIINTHAEKMECGTGLVGGPILAVIIRFAFAGVFTFKLIDCPQLIVHYYILIAISFIPPLLFLLIDFA